MKGTPIFKSFTRLSNLPLDDSSVFETLQAATKYVTAEGTSAYQGQLISAENNLYLVILDKSTPSGLALSYIPDEADVKDYIKKEVKHYIDTRASDVVLAYINHDLPVESYYGQDWLLDERGAIFTKENPATIYIVMAALTDENDFDERFTHMMFIWDGEKYCALNGGKGEGGTGNVFVDTFTIKRNSAGMISAIGLTDGQSTKSAADLFRATTITIIEDEEGDF